MTEDTQRNNVMTESKSVSIKRSHATTESQLDVTGTTERPYEKTEWPTGVSDTTESPLSTTELQAYATEHANTVPEKLLVNSITDHQIWLLSTLTFVFFLSSNK